MIENFVQIAHPYFRYEQPKLTPLTWPVFACQSKYYMVINKLKGPLADYMELPNAYLVSGAGPRGIK